MIDNPHYGPLRHAIISYLIELQNTGRRTFTLGEIFEKFAIEYATVDMYEVEYKITDFFVDNQQTILAEAQRDISEIH